MLRRLFRPVLPLILCLSVFFGRDAHAEWRTTQIDDNGATTSSQYSSLYTCQGADCLFRGDGIYGYFDSVRPIDTDEAFMSFNPAVRTGYYLNGYTLRWPTGNNGWATMQGYWADSRGNISTKVHQSAIATAQWTPVIYGVTFYRNEHGTGTGSNTSVGTYYEKYDTGWYSNSAATNLISSVSIPTAPSSSYVFSGYYTTQNALGVSSCSGTQVTNSGGVFVNNSIVFNRTPSVYACWTAVQSQYYQITLNQNGATTNSSNTKIYERKNNGFYRSANSSYPITNSIFASTSNGGAGFDQPTKTKSVFNGYRTAANSGSQIIDYNGNIVVAPNYFTAATTIYAWWVPQLTITLDPGLGTACAQTSLSVWLRGSMPTLSCTPTPPSGYRFVGYVWGGLEVMQNNFAYIGTTPQVDTVTWTINRTLTAVYEEDPTYATIVYSFPTSNDVTGTVSLPISDGASYRIPDLFDVTGNNNPYIPDGFDEFYGWEIRHVIYTPGDEVSPIDEWDLAQGRTINASAVFRKECDAGYYFKASNQTCTVCPAGKYCLGVSVLSNKSNSDQGIDGEIRSGYYSTGGAYSDAPSFDSCLSEYNCGACPSAYPSSATGTTTRDNCYVTLAPGNYVATTREGSVTCAAGGYCPGGSVIYFDGSGHATTGGRTPCGAGTYNGNTGSSAASACVVCGNDTYTASTGSTSCASTCASGYQARGTTAADHDNANDCKITCSAGTYVSTASGTCGDVGNGYYRAGSETVSQGSTGTRNACSSLKSDYTNSDSGRDAATDCYLNTTSTKFVKAQNANQVTCDAGGYCPGSVKVYYGSTGGRTPCGAGTYNGNTGSSAASACVVASNGYYVDTTGATEQTQCPANYRTGSDNGRDAATDCYVNTTAGNYIATANATQAQCPANNYCPSTKIYYGSTGGSTSCNTLASGFYPNSAAGSDEAADCYTNSISGKYVATENASSATNCGDNNHYKGSHTVNYGSTSSCSTVSSGYYSTGGTETTRTGQAQCTGATYCVSGVKSDCPSGYNADTSAGKTVNTQCKISCGGGSYVATANGACSNVGNGYWAAAGLVAYGSTSTRNQCPAGTTTSGSGYGADESGDCGRELHIGSNLIYLRSDKKTTPSLNAKIGGTTYYGNMYEKTGAISGALHMKYSNKTYMVCDETGTSCTGL